jgi:hypothetical protein
LPILDVSVALWVIAGADEPEGVEAIKDGLYSIASHVRPLSNFWFHVGEPMVSLKLASCRS